MAQMAANLTRVQRGEAPTGVVDVARVVLRDGAVALLRRPAPLRHSGLCCPAFRPPAARVRSWGTRSFACAGLPEWRPRLRAQCRHPCTNTQRAAAPPPRCIGCYGRTAGSAGGRAGGGEECGSSSEFRRWDISEEVTIVAAQSAMNSVACLQRFLPR